MAPWRGLGVIAMGAALASAPGAGCGGSSFVSGGGDVGADGGGDGPSGSGSGGGSGSSGSGASSGASSSSGSSSGSSGSSSSGSSSGSSSSGSSSGSSSSGSSSGSSSSGSSSGSSSSGSSSGSSSSGSGSGSSSSGSSGGSSSSGSSSGSSSSGSSSGSSSSGSSSGGVVCGSGGTDECVPAAPSGWSGPFEVYDGPGPAPGCGSAYDSTPSYQGNYGLNAPPAACSCSCGSPTGVTCSAVDLTAWQNDVTSCSTGLETTATVDWGTCQTIDVGSCTANITATDPTPMGGSCAAGPVTKSVPPVTWSDDVQACAPAVSPTPAGCALGQVCAPLPDSGYGVCIAQSFDLPCPVSSGYSAKYLGYAAFSDTRNCTDCSCGAVAGAACSADLYLTSSCSGGSTISGWLPWTCTKDTSICGTVGAFLQGGPSGGTCPGTSSPTGGASPAQPTTFCCLP